jgi:hypothetical protein
MKRQSSKLDIQQEQQQLYLQHQQQLYQQHYGNGHELYDP